MTGHNKYPEDSYDRNAENRNNTFRLAIGGNNQKKAKHLQNFWQFGKQPIFKKKSAQT
jgi:hypothetical protein